MAGGKGARGLEAKGPDGRARVGRWLAAWVPAAFAVGARERWRAVAGAALGILLAAWGSRWLNGGAALDSLWLVAPLGASAVLVFAVPASPLAQPWAVIGGNTASALVGIACVHLPADPALAAAVAVAAAIATMFALRCLHPPGGATALLAVLSQAADPAFALSPVLLNSALLVAAGVVYNSATGRRYPHRAAPAAAPEGARFSAADVDAALVHYGQVLDVSRDDLEALLHQVELAAYRRRIGGLRCADIMTPEPLAVSAATPLRKAWALMRGRRVKALPVVDDEGVVEGIVTVADFMRRRGRDGRRGLGGRLRDLIRRNGRRLVRPRAYRAVGELMTRQVHTAPHTLDAVDLVPMFAASGHHHLPVVDERRRLVGMVTQSDMVRALHRAIRPEPAAG